MSALGTLPRVLGIKFRLVVGKVNLKLRFPELFQLRKLTFVVVETRKGSRLPLDQLAGMRRCILEAPLFFFAFEPSSEYFGEWKCGSGCGSVGGNQWAPVRFVLVRCPLIGWRCYLLVQLFRSQVNFSPAPCAPAFGILNDPPQTVGWITTRGASSGGLGAGRSWNPWWLISENFHFLGLKTTKLHHNVLGRARRRQKVQSAVLGGVARRRTVELVRCQIASVR